MSENDMKEKAKEVKEDTEKLKIELQETNDDRTRARKVYGYFRKHAKKYILITGIGGFLLAVVFTDITIPEWLYLGLATSLATVIITYPYVKMVSKWFIKDNRKPILVQDPENLYDVELWYGPQKRMGEIEFINGEPHQIRTNERGVGIEVEHFEVIEQENEKMQPYAEGTWLGSKPASDIKQRESEIDSMKNQLEPLAMIGYGYKVKWPYIMHSLSQKVTNAIVHDFQGITTYRGSEMNAHVQEIIEDFSPEKVQNQFSSNEPNSMNEQTNGQKDNIDIEKLAEIGGIDLEGVEKE